MIVGLCKTKLRSRGLMWMGRLRRSLIFSCCISTLSGCGRAVQAVIENFKGEAYTSLTANTVISKAEKMKIWGFLMLLLPQGQTHLLPEQETVNEIYDHSDLGQEPTTTDATTSTPASTTT
ncbi:unnamed protein product, partial [Meganyctiphanes norvegica]